MSLAWKWKSRILRPLISIGLGVVFGLVAFIAIRVGRWDILDYWWLAIALSMAIAEHRHSKFPDFLSDRRNGWEMRGDTGGV